MQSQTNVFRYASATTITVARVDLSLGRVVQIYSFCSKSEIVDDSKINQILPGSKDSIGEGALLSDLRCLGFDIKEFESIANQILGEGKEEKINAKYSLRTIYPRKLDVFSDSYCLEKRMKSLEGRFLGLEGGHSRHRRNRRSLFSGQGDEVYLADHMDDLERIGAAEAAKAMDNEQTLTYTAFLDKFMRPESSNLLNQTRSFITSMLGPRRGGPAGQGREQDGTAKDTLR